MSVSSAWALLLASGVLEVVWALGLPRTDGFTRLVPSAVVLVAMVLSMLGLSLAVRVLPVGTAYAVWVGIGAIGTAAIGMVWLGEPATLARIACLLLIVAGIAGLNLLGR